jgi:hypothetical protein
MRHITSKLAVLLLVPTMVLLAQAPKPLSEIKSLNDWVGDWTLTGTAKDGPKAKESSLNWRLHGRWILSGHAVQIDQEWIENGVTTKNLEILGFDAAKKAFLGTGYGESGLIWITTSTVKGDTWFESGKTTLPNGRVTSFSGRYRLSPDRLTMTMTAEQELDGSKWVWFSVKGTKTPLKSRP